MWFLGKGVMFLLFLIEMMSKFMLPRQINNRRLLEVA